ncbi:BrnT family toxin [Granulicella aggregans]|uniref:BrnT family toxin n=1 Tax=Granulicella aggregans TaxID=474949 RepID=UPI0021E05B17|nr:BrnT family toxin [Granulicella aggregans]
MRFEWDDRKNESNLKKRGVRFETAAVTFDDPHLQMELDRIEVGETRWQTVGRVDDDYLLLVVHLLATDEEEDEEVVRIISAREATPKERRRYERGL